MGGFMDVTGDDIDKQVDALFVGGVGDLNLLYGVEIF